MTSKEIVEIKVRCLELAIEALSLKSYIGLDSIEAMADAVVKGAKTIENYFGIATAEDK